MALQGTLDTFALADLVRLLATTEKTGELAIDGDRGQGRLWFAGGDIVAGEPAPTGDVVEALFALLRLEDGDFRFDADVAPDEPTEARRALDVLSEAEERLEAWRPVEALVPSPAVTVALRAELDADEVRVDRARWRLLVAVAGAATAADLASALDLDHVATAFALRDLIDAGLVEVGVPVEDEEPVVAAVEAVAVEVVAVEVDHVDVDAAADAVVAEVPLTDAEAAVFEPVEIVPLEIDRAAESDAAHEPAAADQPAWTPVEPLPTISSAAELLSSGGPLADDMAVLDGGAPGPWEPLAPAAPEADAAPEVEPAEADADTEVETAADVEDVDADDSDEVAPAETLAEALPSLDALPTLDKVPADALPTLDADPAPAPGSLAVDLDARLGGAAADHSYLDRAAGADALPEPLPSAPAAADALPGEPAEAGSDRAPWPAPRASRGDEDLPLDALSPAAAAAVAAAAASEDAPDEVEAGRRVLRRIISTGKG